MSEIKKQTDPQHNMNGMHILGIIVLTMLMTVGITYWVLTTYIFAREFKTVTLTNKEEQVLDSKLRVLGIDSDTSVAEKSVNIPDEFDAEGKLRPKRYSEKGANRKVVFSEREVNALLANNTDLAKQLSIDLSGDLVSARILMPLDPDFPVLGGKTLRASTGVEIAYHDGKPMVVLKGFSIWGVPIPNAWLGNLKNIDLVEHYGVGQGFWKSFAEGVEDIRVEDDELIIKFKE